MGYMLKEALKTLCGVNQWSYAVLWKFGYQNPKILIWEECYFESTSFSRLPGISGNGDPEIAFQDSYASWDSTKTCDFQASVEEVDKVHLLLNKMLANNHVNIVGEGLVGRVAFTSNHHWILSKYFNGESHPPEVLKEVCQQFSAGMKTVVVIPVIPLGVVQFGSRLTIMENSGFVNDVTSLLIQTGEVLFGGYASKEPAPTIDVPVPGYSSPVDLSRGSNMSYASSFLADSFNCVGSSIDTSVLDNQTAYSWAREIQSDSQSVSVLQASSTSTSHLKVHNYNQEAKSDPAMKFNFSSANQLINGVVKAEVIPSNSSMWSTLDLHSCSSSSFNHGALKCTEQSDRIHQGPLSIPNTSAGLMRSAIRKNPNLISSSNESSNTLQPVDGNHRFNSGICSVSDAKRTVDENIISTRCAACGLKNVSLPKMEASFTNSVDHLTTMTSLVYSSGSQQSELYVFNEEIENHVAQALCAEDDRKHKFGSQIHSLNNAKYDDLCLQPQSGDELFDILGVDFKNKLFSSFRSGGSSNKSSPNTYHSVTNNIPSNLASSKILNTSQESSDTGIFSTATDHLLDAVVSNVHSAVKQSMDDSISCRKTLTNTSSSSISNVSLPYNRFMESEPMNGELLGVPKCLAKPGLMSSCSSRTGFSKEESGARAQNSSVYGSQISSWIEKGHHSTKLNNVCSKKPSDTSKTNRKRAKPVGNPRPRPKDRQMVQDRVKELREIVPNGEKCSIDTLLERTIKHMIFLQSVRKHADKLKQTGRSKITSNDGSMLLKDNFERGATWAYEVGSNSMACPIIVEDLNQPRQMLIEMLCEEGGFFLEIADMIRGLGLSILKGLMETRNDKIWARFTVEADRDVTRMEIFISLVRLLEQNSKGCVPQANNFSNAKTRVQQFHQAATTLPLTGHVSHNFQ